MSVLPSKYLVLLLLLVRVADVLPVFINIARIAKALFDRRELLAGPNAPQEGHFAHYTRIGVRDSIGISGAGSAQPRERHASATRLTATT